MYEGHDFAPSRISFRHRGQNHPFIVSYRWAHDAHRVSCSVRLLILAQEYVIDV